MTLMQTVVAIFAAALADVIVADLDAVAVVDSAAADVVVVVAVVVVAAAGVAAVVAGGLNSDLVSSSELH